MIICTELFDFDIPHNKQILVSESADQIFHLLHNKHHPKRTANHYISKSANISKLATVESNVTIEDNVTIEAGSFIGENSIIKRGAYIGPNCTIGSQGMLPKLILGHKQHLKHFGGVEVGQNCYIHAGTNISKGLFHGDSTIIGDETHLGIQVNIAHDAKVGRQCEISGNCVIAGRATLEDKVFIGSHSCVSNWVNIGEGATVKIGSVVIDNVKDNTEVSGNYAINHKRHLLNHAKTILNQ